MLYDEKREGEIMIKEKIKKINKSYIIIFMIAVAIFIPYIKISYNYIIASAFFNFFVQKY